MGTYVLKANGVASKTVEWSAFNSTANPGVCSILDADLVDVAFPEPKGTPAVGVLTQRRFCDVLQSCLGDNLIRFQSTQSDPVWFLDGAGVGVTFLSLPSGFTIDSAVIGLEKTSGTLALSYYQNAANQMFLQFSALQESPQIAGATIGGFAKASFPHPSLPISALSLLLNGMGLRYNCVLGASDTIECQYLNISGNYSLSLFQWTIDPVSGTSLDPGETVTVTSDPTDSTALCLNEITQIEIVGCGVVIPTTLEKHLLIFTIPAGCSGTPAIVITGNGTQFSGTITLGTFPILAAEASGIYVFTKNKLNDTLYSGARDGTTFDVKIPDPFIKTGFIGG